MCDGFLNKNYNEQDNLKTDNLNVTLYVSLFPIKPRLDLQTSKLKFCIKSKFLVFFLFFSPYLIVGRMTNSQ